MRLQAMLGLKRNAPKLSPEMQAEIATWFLRTEFSTNWTTGNFPLWVSILSEHRSRIADVLEVGSWEGRSAVFFLNFMPNCKITCVDTFAGAPEAHMGDPNYVETLKLVEHRFDRNLERFGARMEKVKSRSVPALDTLAARGRRYDLIYIDGSHHRNDVLVDSLLAWPLLNPGGILIWDDYQWRGYGDDSPGPAIDSFLRLHKNDVTRLWKGRQMVVRRAA